MDAAGQVTQFGDGLLGAALGGSDQLQDPIQVGLPGPIGHAAELLHGQPQLHGDSDHLGLRAIMQVPLDPAQPRGRIVHHVGPGLLQLTHPVGAVLLQAVDGPEDQHRAQQWHQSHPVAVREQKDAKDEIPEASGKAENRPGMRMAVFP